ncbi:MAG: type II toxin-antitoxin system CcdA family antitoxin [Magnetococcales bacterium]|nr:type II toxin-antitoxin system CcdA family antitoxin [Magnetococcales bacterium]MBF0151126.1 type II toxin-antitoxin system CcdA family antitoxin [Magnetococcales bacterium]MBF0174707.1 type II toxin-antitoxin system CcdA family antitoxin [Magnetococcales bacterium]MBF0346794.1 type II toxin-antitoxin system CcdA family antitoxin [Magnetococcales bacterium]
METPLFDPLAPKRPLNVRINSTLAAQAKALKINISQELENHLAQVVAERKRHTWQEENRTAIEVYNQRIERDGPFSDGERLF